MDGIFFGNLLPPGIISSLAFCPAPEQGELLRRLHSVLWNAGAEPELLSEVWGVAADLQEGRVDRLDPDLEQRLVGFEESREGGSYKKSLERRLQLAGPLTLSFDNDARTYPVLGVSPELEALEDRVVKGIAPVLRSGETPRVLLLGPGMSRTDPLYALRFLNKIQEGYGRAGELLVVEMRDSSLLRRYYEGLPRGDHRLTVHFGTRWEELGGAIQAHILMTLHPGLLYENLARVHDGFLVSGGMVVWQEDLYSGFLEDANHDALLLALRTFYSPQFELTMPIQSGKLFDTPFARSFPHVRVMALRKK